MTNIASTKVSELTSVKTTGEPVNVHVVKSVPSPKPDFEAMQKLIQRPEKGKADSESSDG